MSSGAQSVIFVSAGHHPDAPGACYEGICEHEEALHWASLIAYQCNGSAVVVPPGILRSKVAFINSWPSARESIAIEVHFNSDPSRAGKGSETLYHPASVRGKELAETLANALGNIYPPGRGAKEGWYRLDRNRGPNYFLAKTLPAAVIIEPEFMHNYQAIVASRARACASIAGILRGFLHG